MQPNKYGGLKYLENQNYVFSFLPFILTGPFSSTAFYLEGGTDTKCFQEEAPMDTTAVVNALQSSRHTPKSRRLITWFRAIYKQQKYVGEGQTLGLKSSLPCSNKRWCLGQSRLIFRENSLLQLQIFNAFSHAEAVLKIE
jgi:hypothetical protein